jgi:hypothetical protein
MHADELISFPDKTEHTSLQQCGWGAVHTSCEEGAGCGAGRSSPLLSAVRSMTVWPSDLGPAAGRMSLPVQGAAA